MEDLIKKVLATGIGAAILARDKVNEIIDDLVEKGKLSEQEGRKYLDEIKAYTSQSKEEAEKNMKELLENMLKRMNIPTKDEVDLIKKRVQELERLVIHEQVKQEGK